MDLVHDDRGSVVVEEEEEEEEEDRISNLPDDIIHHILSFLDMKYAVQTSTLSKKWEHIWTSMPHLSLNSRTFHNVTQFSKFVNHALSHRNNVSEVSTVELIFTGPTAQVFVKNIVDYAYLHNVRHLNMTCDTRHIHMLPQYLFSSHTLKHLTLNNYARQHCTIRIPKSGWDFPALETLNLSNMRLGDVEDTSLDLFSNCVNLKELTLHRVSMFGLKIFNICCPKLSNLTVTNVFSFPGIFNVVAPQLENWRATIDASYTSSPSLQLSTNGLNSLEKVSLSLSNPSNKKKIRVPVLLNLFQNLCSAKILILDVEIIEILSSCLDQLLREPCTFNNLKCLKIGTIPLYRKNHIAKMAVRVRNYLLENSPTATFIMDLPQKRPREQVPNDLMAKKVAKLEERIKVQDEAIANQKEMFEALKLQHDNLMARMIKYKMEELKELV